MSSTLTATIKELLEKVPNFRDMVDEAAKPPVVEVADIAYVYNGYDPLDLQYLGMYQYHFPFQEVTRIEARPNHREVDANNSEFLAGVKQLSWKIIPLKGESIARELIENRMFTERGMVVFLDGPTCPRAIKEAANQIGLDFRRKEIERFKVGRDKARARVPGYKLKPDPRVYEWMKVLCPDDPMFGEQHSQTDSNSQISQAINLLTRLVSQKEAVSAPVIIQAGEGIPIGSSSTESVTIETSGALKPPPLPGEPQKRKPLETDAQFEARREAWVKDYIAKFGTAPAGQ